MIATIELVGDDNEEDEYHLQQIIEQIEMMCQNRGIAHSISITLWRFGKQHQLYSERWEPQ